MSARTPDFDLRNNPKNFIINGDMRISQRGTSFAAIASGIYSLDRWWYGKAGAAVHTVSQDTDVPTLAQAGYLFQNSLRLNLTTPDTSIAAGDNVSINQYVEGYNWANLAQKTFSLSFWVKATLPGTYCVAFRNSVPDRSYVTEYVINSASTWEYKTVTVSASPVAGTWNYINGIGLDIRWVLSAGSTFQTTANTWATGNLLSTVNQVNGTNTGATDFRITGVQLNEGFQALPFRLFGGDISGEVAACQRYYEKNYPIASPPGTILGAGSEPNTFRGFNTGVVATRGFSLFMVLKRTAPAITYYSGTSATSGFVDINGVAQAIGASAATETGTWVEYPTGISGAYTMGFFYAANAEL